MAPTVVTATPVEAGSTVLKAAEGSEDTVEAVPAAEEGEEEALVMVAAELDFRMDFHTANIHTLSPPAEP